MGPFLESEPDNYKYIISIVCQFSGWPESYPTRTKSAEEVARILLNEFIPRHSTPYVLQSDNGTEFVNAVVDKLSANLGICRITSTPYQPSSNGAAERFNRVLKYHLRMRVAPHQRDWPTHLPACLLAYRVSVHETTRFSPFFITTGRDPVLAFDTLLKPKLKYAGEDFVTIQLQRLHEAFTLMREYAKDDRERRLSLIHI